MRRAQEVFWGILCSQKKQNSIHPRGNGNCEGIADALALLRSQKCSQGAPCSSPIHCAAFIQLPHTRTSSPVVWGIQNRSDLLLFFNIATGTK